MIPNAILAFSAISMFNFGLGCASVAASASKTRLKAAKAFVASATLSALFVCLQSDPQIQLQCSVLQFCMLAPILLSWLLILVRYHYRQHHHDVRTEQIEKLEAALISDSEDKPSTLTPVK
ncbi:hypothetical protein BH10CYA1_BH10CYA1_18220 [soil metagenome]